MAMQVTNPKGEADFWQATPQLRWRRPKATLEASAREPVLEQLFQRLTGQTEWRPVPIFEEDGA